MENLLAPDLIESYPGAQSVARAMAVLKAFDDTHPTWTLGDLSEKVGLNKTTTHRLLAALENEGLVMRSAVSGAYCLGLALVALGGSALRSNDLRLACRAELETLAQTTGETAMLEVLYRRQTLVLDEVSSRTLAGLSHDIGVRLPLHATSTGKLLLAYRSPSEIEELLRLPLPALTPNTITDPDCLRQALTQIRRQGYATAVEELEVSFVAVAAPVYTANRTVAAALSVGGPTLRMTTARLPEIIAATQVAAQRVSRQLGYRPG